MTQRLSHSSRSPTAPLVAPGQLRLRGVGPQPIQQRLALLQRQTREVGIGATPQEQCLAPGHRMGAHERVPRSRRVARVLLRGVAGAQAPGAVAGRVVHTGAPGDGRAQVLRQRFVGPVHVVEAGVAAGRRDLPPIERAARRGLLAVAHVRVPEGLRVAEKRVAGLAVRPQVGHDQNFRVALGRGRGAVGGLHGTDLPRKGDVLRLGQVLPAEAQHQVLAPRGVQGRHHLRCQRLGEIQAAHLRPQRGAGGHDVQGGGGL